MWLMVLGRFIRNFSLSFRKQQLSGRR